MPQSLCATESALHEFQIAAHRLSAHAESALHAVTGLRLRVVHWIPHWAGLTKCGHPEDADDGIVSP